MPRPPYSGPGQIRYEGRIRWPERLPEMLHPDLAPRILTELHPRLYLQIPALREALPRAERTGELPRLTQDSWFGYCHRPQQLRAELNAVGLEVADLVGVDVPALLMADITERMNDPVDRAVVLDAARALERIPEMLGIGPHLLATATSRR